LKSQIPGNSTEPLGIQVLKSREFFTEANWYWIGVGATVGFMLLFNICFALALTFLNGKCHYLLNSILLESWSLYLYIANFCWQLLRSLKLLYLKNPKGKVLLAKQEELFSYQTMEVATKTKQVKELN
jgi:hypothetical protein